MVLMLKTQHCKQLYCIKTSLQPALGMLQLAGIQQAVTSYVKIMWKNLKQSHFAHLFMLTFYSAPGKFYDSNKVMLLHI